MKTMLLSSHLTGKDTLRTWSVPQVIKQYPGVKAEIRILYLSLSCPGAPFSLLLYLSREKSKLQESKLF